MVHGPNRAIFAENHTETQPTVENELFCFLNSANHGGKHIQTPATTARGMSLTTDELNYLVWRYVQEQGLALTALALQQESTATQFDDKFGASVPIGSLVNLVQKGILYAETDQLVGPNGDTREDSFYRDKFTLLHALRADAAINPEIENKGRFSNWREEANNDGDIDTDKREDSPEFIPVLKKRFGFEPSTTADWNPTAASVLAFGLSDSRAKITVLTDGEPKQIQLSHPTSFNASAKDYSADVTAVSWSPIGNQLLTAIETGELRLWSADGQLKNVLYSHHAAIILIRWSPDSQYVLTSDADNSTILWNATTGVVLQSYDLKESGSSIATTPAATTAELTGLDATWIDNTTFIIPGLNGSALVFNVTDRTPQGTLLGHTKPLTVSNFNKEHQLLLTASDDRTIRIWNGSNFNNTQILVGHTQSITYAEWITKDIVISTSIDSSIRVWDVRNGRNLFTEVLDGIPIVLAQLSPDKSSIIVATVENTLVLFSIDLLIQDKLKAAGEYQSDVPQDDSQKNIITSLKWSSDSKNVVASYSHAESAVVSIK